MSDETLIVGPGRVGSTLAVSLDRRGWPVTAIAGRRSSACEDLAARLRGNVQRGEATVLTGPFNVILLAVADDAIGEVGASLLSHGLVDAGSVVLHLSGVHSSEILQSLRTAGAAVGSMHPLQTFADTEAGLRALPGTHWFIEGDPPALDVARRLIAVVEGTAHDMSAADKVTYHAGASIACNFLNALLDAALEAAAPVGLEREEMLKALHPLLRATLDNALETGPEKSLTGPISRGDGATVRLHLDALEHVDELSRLYRLLGRRSLAMAVSSGRLEAPAAARMASLLADPQS